MLPVASVSAEFPLVSQNATQTASFATFLTKLPVGK
jgi:hypothetical protein